MDKISILRMGDFLLVPMQFNLYDRLAIDLEKNLAAMIIQHKAKGVLIDVSAVEIIDSFMSRILENITRMSCLLDAATVIVGMKPAVGLTLIELGINMNGTQWALNVEKGMLLLQKSR